MCNTHHLCQLPFDVDPIRTAVIYCADGRFGGHTEDFLQTALSLERFDRLVVPGGAARLIDRFAVRDEQRAASNDLKFLVEAHRLERVILIAHSDCAFYTTRTDLSPQQLEKVQCEDLGEAARIIKRATNVARTDTYFARRVNEGVRFEPVT